MALFTLLLFSTLPGHGTGNFIAFSPCLWGCFNRRSWQRLDLSDDRGHFSHPDAQTRAGRGRYGSAGAAYRGDGNRGGARLYLRHRCYRRLLYSKAFGTSLAMTGSPVGAMKVFPVFYIVCILVTGWFTVAAPLKLITAMFPFCLFFRLCNEPCNRRVPLCKEQVMSKLVDKFRYFRQKRHVLRRSRSADEQQPRLGGQLSSALAVR